MSVNPYAPPALDSSNVPLYGDGPENAAAEARSKGFDRSETVRFWPRAGARILDIGVSVAASMVGSFVGALVLASLEAGGAIKTGFLDRSQSHTGLSLVLGFVAPVIWETIAEATGGATLGKLLLGYRVVNVDGTRCSVKSGIIRNLAYIIESFFFAWPAYKAMAASVLNQRNGDRLAGTVVVRKSALASRPHAFLASAQTMTLGILGALFACITYSAVETILFGL